MNIKNIITVSIALILTTSCLFYFLQNKKSYSHFIVSLGSSDIPITKVEIQGKEYLLEIDLGSKFQISLNKDILENLKKHSCGSLKSRDVKGNAYEVAAYRLERIKIGDLTFKNVIATEVNENFVKNTTLWIDSENTQPRAKRTVGKIGRALLENLNILIDIQQHSMLILGKDVTSTAHKFDKLNKVPFEIGRTGVILKTNTDFGEKKMSLDTGSTISFIRACPSEQDWAQNYQYGLPYLRTLKFEIGNTDFGGMDLYLLDITSELNEIDGILGMDFLKNHVIYLDFHKKLAYVADSSTEKLANQKL